ncbi:MAG: Protease-associated [Myxococcaceae bacterium]|nr:Protease-associated [Myxococcaceae bacterium]
MRRAQTALVIAAVLSCASPVLAESTAVIQTLGSGFLDATVVKPVGGNSGTTLGEQRQIALQKAADIWTQLLDSKVPIEIQAFFSEMGCTDHGGPIAGASAASLFQLPGADGSASGPWYHSALANSLAGRDLDPDAPDITISINASVDGSCSDVLGSFYYGFDGNHGVKQDFVDIVLHELAHGLGFSSFVDPSTGEPETPDEVDVFTTHLYDLDSAKGWGDLTPQERVVSATRTRRVVWNGPEAQKQSAQFLKAGTPAVSFTPTVPGFSGTASAVEGASNPSLAPVTARLVQATPANGCSMQGAAVQGAVVLVDLSSGGCPATQAVTQVQRAGGLGVLLIVRSDSDAPASVLPDGTLQSPLPILTLTPADGRRIVGALAAHPLTVSLAGDPKQLLGADTQGRPLLFTPSSVLDGSSVSHFDTSASPDLLMEPYATDMAAHRVDLTLAVLRDMGWAALCGNGHVDGDEQCDEGSANSDLPTAHCGIDCRSHGCGDGIVVSPEACDHGRDNSDSISDACRSDCQLAHCGDGVVDTHEACDQGAQNSDTVPGACRTSCQPDPCDDKGLCDAGTQCSPACNSNSNSNSNIVMPLTGSMTPPTFSTWTQSSTDPQQTKHSHSSGCSVAAQPDKRGPSGFVWPWLVSLAALLGRRLKRQKRT